MTSALFEDPWDIKIPVLIEVLASVEGSTVRIKIVSKLYSGSKRNKSSRAEEAIKEMGWRLLKRRGHDLSLKGCSIFLRGNHESNECILKTTAVARERENSGLNQVMAMTMIRSQILSIL